MPRTKKTATPGPEQPATGETTNGTRRTTTRGRGRRGTATETPAEVPPTTPVAAGLLRGDVIDSVNGIAVLTGAELRDLIHSMKEGEEITLQVRRGPEHLEIKARLHAPPAEEAGTNGNRNRLGVTVVPGVVVTEVLPDTPAAAAGFAPGDIIGSVNGIPVLTGEQLLRVVLPLPERAEVSLAMTRGQEAREIHLHLDETPAETGESAQELVTTTVG
jgi:S1-C subfamily serine protease